MKRLLGILLVLLPVAFCQDALINAQTLLNSEKNINCVNFTSARANTACCNYTSKGVHKEYFFELFTTELTFTAAQESCKSKGGYLASIRDMNDLNKILPLMANGTKAFLGFSRDSTGHYHNVDWVSQFFETPIVPIVGDTVHECVVLDKDTNATSRENCTVPNHYVCRYNYLDNTIVQISVDRKTWHGADEACQGINGQLVSLQSTAQKRVINCLLTERNKHFAWTGLNDLTKELHFRWADYSLSKFQPFCNTPTSDPTRDCVKIAARSHPITGSTSSSKDTNDLEFGCLKQERCGVGHPYVCQIKNPGCDEGTNRFRDYITTLLSDAAQANSVCGGSCKFGGKGVSSLFKKKTKVPRRKKKTTVIEKITIGKNGKTKRKVKGAKQNKKNKKSSLNSLSNLLTG